jgi:type VI secretion system secreted protein Hcp
MLKSRASVLAAVLLVMFGYSTSLRAAVDMFLDITGIPGESTDPIHTNQVDVLAWSWGMYNSGTTRSAVAGKSTFQYLNLTKYVDKASPLLMLHCANGGPISKVTLYVRKAGVIPIEYIKLQLTNVLVSSVSTGGSGGEDKLTENISLNFAKLQLDYIPTKPDGSADTPFSFRWDIPGISGTVISPVGGLISTLTYTNGAPKASLTWNSIAGVNYQVWTASDLKTTFQPYGSPTISAGDGTTSVTVPANAIKMFFRIETLSSQ